MEDKEIKIGPKLSKRLMYLGFEEKIGAMTKWKISRYFVHPCGIQVRVNEKQKTLSLLDKKGWSIKTKGTFLSLYIKDIIEGRVLC